MTIVSMQELLDAGIHSGHQARRWNPKMKRFVFTEYNDIYITDLQQALTYVDEALGFVKEAAAHGGSILFVGIKKQVQEAVRSGAGRVDMPYINHRWSGGMLTDFAIVSKHPARLRELQAMDAAENGYEDRGKKEILMLTRECAKLERTLGGIRDVSKVPSTLWTVDTNKEYTAIAEAKKLGVPAVAILDTNCNPDDVDFPILGNDDATRAVSVLIRAISTAVGEGRKARAERGTDAAREAVSDTPIKSVAENTDQIAEMDTEGSTATETVSVG